MKTTRLFALLLILMLILSGCSTNKTIDHGETGSTVYSDYDFWKGENELRLVTLFELNYLDDTSLLPTKQAWIAPSSSVMKTIDVLRNGIIKFFKDKYQIDLSEEIHAQEIRICPFEQDETDIITMGYYDKNVLYLNGLLFTEEFHFLFEQTYVHECLHHLGIVCPSDNLITEGMTDAFTDLVMSYMGKDFYGTDAYFEPRTLCYQIIAVDQELPLLYFNNKSFSMSKRISERLQDVKQVYEKSEDVGKKLVDLLDILYSQRSSVISQDVDLFDYAYDAQEIVRAYCKSFAPDKSTIQYIRNHYLVEDFEMLEYFDW